MKEAPMTRATLLPTCVAALLSSALTLAGAMLAYPPLSRAEVGAQLPPSVVRAQRFEVIDANGAIVATLGSEAERSAGLFILDAAGQQRAALGVGGDGLSFVQVFTPQGAPQFGGAVLQARPDGSVTLAAVDASQARAQLVLTAEDAAALQVVGRPGGSAVQVP
jgi:hypothetical protein